MAFEEDAPLAANVIATDLATMNANWEYVISGDGTAGRVLRILRLDIAYHATASSVGVYTTSVWNGDAIDSSASPHELTKSDGDTNWALNAGGTALTIEAAGLSGNAIFAYAVISYNKGGETDVYVSPAITSNDIVLTFYSGSAGGTYDLSALESGESIIVDIIYITNA